MTFKNSKFMTSIKNRLELLPSLSRLAPAIILFISILCMVVNPSSATIYIVICIMSCSLINHILKIIFKLIFGLSKTGSLPLLGIGMRPKGASDCGLTLSGGSSKSFGMPSGHSQTTWFIVSYLLFITIDILKDNLNKYNSTNTNEYILFMILNGFGILLLVSIGIYVSYSRVYIEGCHTIQQVILGGLIGASLGFVAYILKDKFNDSLNVK
jgi:hypothetical protein